MFKIILKREIKYKCLNLRVSAVYHNVLKKKKKKKENNQDTHA